MLSNMHMRHYLVSVNFYEQVGPSEYSVLYYICCARRKLDWTLNSIEDLKLNTFVSIDHNCAL